MFLSSSWTDRSRYNSPVSLKRQVVSICVRDSTALAKSGGVSSQVELVGETVRNPVPCINRNLMDASHRKTA